MNKKKETKNPFYFESYSSSVHPENEYFSNPVQPKRG